MSAFGVVAIGAGAAVTAGAGDVVESTASGAWIAAIALAVGVVLLPGGRRERTTHGDVENDRSDLVDLDA